MNSATIAVIDFGSQYTQLIARRVRENHVRSLIYGPRVSAQKLREDGVVGVILSGGPGSAYDRDAITCDDAIFDLDVPILGICYGMQLLCRRLGADVAPAVRHEYGKVQLIVLDGGDLLVQVESPTPVWTSHGDMVTAAPDVFVAIGQTANCPIAAVRHRDKPIYGVQFHPEVAHTPAGHVMIRNFVETICKAPADWSMGDVIDGQVSRIRATVGETDRVICGLSGGVDSSVVAAMVHRAIGDRLVCIFVDNGLVRHGERDLVESTFRRHFQMNLRVVDASERFLGALAGVTDPQEKRRIIGREFIDAFRAEATTIDSAKFLAQGTLYPDVIESGHGTGGVSANIKLHHNVGGLPDDLDFELIEPIRELFKDEVRRIAEHLDLPPEITWRHPFPGPGLAVRIIGEITPHRLDLLRQADRITLEEVRAAGWYAKIGQAFAVLIPVSTVGVAGDNRKYADTHLVAIRFVETTDFMTADWVRVDHSLLETISSRIMNEVAGVNRVVYDISSKPPATIEWE